MSDPRTVAGWLLVGGPVLGLIPVAHPSLLKIWSMPRGAFLATVASHRTAWAWLNAGFVLASAATTAGLIVLTGSMPDGGARAAMLACATGYGIAAVLWCVVLAVRTRTTPLLSELGTDASDSRQVRLLEAATTGLFQAFALITAAALVALGAVLLTADPVPAWVGVVALVTGASAAVWLLRTGDIVPAVLYVPTVALGATLL